DWLRLASRAELARSGDAFELPWFPLADVDRVIVSSEGPETLAQWAMVPDQVGLVELVELDAGITSITAATCFRSCNRQVLVTPSWGSLVAAKEADDRKRRIGVWVRLPSLPVRA